jgi:hypothetical protein
MPASRPPPDLPPRTDDAPPAVAQAPAAAPALKPPAEPEGPPRKAFDAWRAAKKTRRSLWEAARVLRAYAVDEPLTEDEYDTAIWMAGRNEVK